MIRLTPGKLPDDPEIEVPSTIDLERKTCALYCSMVKVADSGNPHLMPQVHYVQREYMEQYIETAGHVIALTDTLRYARRFATRQRALRHAALFGAVSMRQLKITRPKEERLGTVGKRLKEIAGYSDESLPEYLKHVAPENKWGTEVLEGYEQFDAARFFGEHAANDMFYEDDLFCGVVLRRVEGVALESPSSLLSSE